MTPLAVLTFIVWSPETFSRHQWLQFFPHGGIEFHTFTSYAIPGAIQSECPSAAICTQQQHVIGYWWEGATSAAIPPASTFIVMGSHTKIGSTVFEQHAGILTHNKVLQKEIPSCARREVMRAASFVP